MSVYYRLKTQGMQGCADIICRIFIVIRCYSIKKMMTYNNVGSMKK